MVALRCSPNAGQFPGEVFGAARPAFNAIQGGDQLYLVTVNCLRAEHLDPSSEGRPGACVGAPARLLFSPGGSGQTSTRFDKCLVTDGSDSWTGDNGFSRVGFELNCDTLPGSSGGPVFKRSGGQIVGLVSGQIRDPITTNKAGHMADFMSANDADLDGYLDFTQEGPHLLWSNRVTGEANLWRLNPSNDAFSSFVTLAARPGLEARAYGRLSPLSDARLLWVEIQGNTSLARIQRFNIADKPTGVEVTHRMPSAWSATDYERTNVGSNKLLWTQNGQAQIWTLNTEDVFVSSRSYSNVNMPRAYAQAYSWRSDGTSMILWHQIDAQGQVFASVWELDTAGNVSLTRQFGPMANARPVAYETFRNGRRLVWQRDDGSTTLWRYNAASVFLNEVTYGPFVSSWSGQDYSYR
jgi:hypothetical protein